MKIDNIQHDDMPKKEEMSAKKEMKHSSFSGRHGQHMEAHHEPKHKRHKRGGKYGY